MTPESQNIEIEEMSIVRQLFGKHIAAEANARNNRRTRF
jgi:hypothetical protein